MGECTREYAGKYYKTKAEKALQKAKKLEEQKNKAKQNGK